MFQSQDKTGRNILVILSKTCKIIKNFITVSVTVKGLFVSAYA